MFFKKKLFFVTLLFVFILFNFYNVINASCNCDISQNLGWNCLGDAQPNHCWCESYQIAGSNCVPENLWPKGSKSSCPELTPADKQEQTTNNHTLARLLDEISNEVQAGGLTFDNFFNNYVTNPFNTAFENDQINYEIFTDVLSDTAPPPSEKITPLSFLWDGIQSLCNFIPELEDSWVGWSVDLIDGITSLSTSLNSDDSYQAADWHTFIEGKIQKSTQMHNSIKNGVYNYTHKWWNHNNLGTEIKKSENSKQKLVNNFITTLFKFLPTQYQSLRKLFADYVNSSGGGISVNLSQKNRDEQSEGAWVMSAYSNSAPALQKKLMEISNSCFQPKNFRDRFGQPMNQVVFHYVEEPYPAVLLVCNLLDNFPITGSFEQVGWNSKKNEFEKSPPVWGCFEGFDSSDPNNKAKLTFPQIRPTCKNLQVSNRCY